MPRVTSRGGAPIRTFATRSPSSLRPESSSSRRLSKQNTLRPGLKPGSSAMLSSAGFTARSSNAKRSASLPSGRTSTGGLLSGSTSRAGREAVIERPAGCRLHSDAHQGNSNPDASPQQSAAPAKPRRNSRLRRASCHRRLAIGVPADDFSKRLINEIRARSGPFSPTNDRSLTRMKRLVEGWRDNAPAPPQGQQSKCPVTSKPCWKRAQTPRTGGKHRMRTCQ